MTKETNDTIKHSKSFVIIKTIPWKIYRTSAVTAAPAVVITKTVMHGPNEKLIIVDICNVIKSR